MNAVRGAEELNLDEFTAAQSEELDEFQEKSAAASYENALYALTCDQINSSTIDPVVSFHIHSKANSNAAFTRF